MARLNMSSLYRQTGQQLEGAFSEAALYLRDINAQDKLTEAKTEMDRALNSWLFDVQRKVKMAPADLVGTGDDKGGYAEIADTNALQAAMSKAVLKLPTPESRQAAESYSAQLVTKAIEQSSLLVSQYQVEYYQNTIVNRLDSIIADPVKELSEKRAEIKDLFNNPETRATLGGPKADSLATEAIQTVVTNAWKDAQVEQLVSAYANATEDPMGGFRKAYASMVNKPIAIWDWGTPDKADDVNIDARNAFSDIEKRALSKIDAIKGNTQNQTPQQVKANKIRDDFVTALSGGVPSSNLLADALKAIDSISGMDAREKKSYKDIVEGEYKDWLGDYTTKPNDQGQTPISLWNQAVKNLTLQKSGQKVDGPVASREYARKLLPFGDRVTNTIIESWVQEIETTSGSSGKAQDPLDAKASTIITRFRELLNSNKDITTELSDYRNEIYAIEGMNEPEKERYVTIINNAYTNWIAEYMSKPLGADGTTRTKLWQDALTNLSNSALGMTTTGPIASEEYAKSLVPFNNPIALRVYDQLVAQLGVAKEATEKVAGTNDIIANEINKMIASRASSLSGGEGKIAGVKPITSADLDKAYVLNGKIGFGTMPQGAVPLINVVGAAQMDRWRSELQNIAANQQKMTELVAKQKAEGKFDSGNLKSYILQNKDGFTKATALQYIDPLKSQISASEYQELEKYVRTLYDNDADPRVKRAINDVKLALGTGKDVATRVDDFELRLAELLDKVPSDQWDKAIAAAKTGFVQEIVIKSAKGLVDAINGRKTDLATPYSQPLDIWLGDWMEKIRGGTKQAATLITELRQEFAKFHGAKPEDVTVNTAGRNITIEWQGRKFEPYLDQGTDRIGYQEIGAKKDTSGNIVPTPPKDLGSDYTTSPGAKQAATTKEQFAAQVAKATSGLKKTDPAYYDAAYKAVMELARGQDAPRDPAQLEKYLYEKGGLTGDVVALAVASAMVEKGYDPIGVYDYAEQQNLSPAALKAVDGMFKQKPKPSSSTPPVPTAQPQGALATAPATSQAPQATTYKTWEDAAKAVFEGQFKGAQYVVKTEPDKSKGQSIGDLFVAAARKAYPTDPAKQAEQLRAVKSSLLGTVDAKTGKPLYAQSDNIFVAAIDPEIKKLEGGTSSATSRLPQPQQTTAPASQNAEPLKYNYSHVVSPDDAGTGWAYKHAGWKNMTYLVALKRIGTSAEKVLNAQTVKTMTGTDIAEALITASKGNKTALAGILADLLAARYGGTDKGQKAFSESDGIIKRLREALK